MNDGTTRDREALPLDILDRIDRAHRDWLASTVGLADRRLDGCEPGLRGWEWRRLKRLCHSELRELRGYREIVKWAAFSPDGRSLASAGADRAVRLWAGSDPVRVGLENLTYEGLCTYPWNVLLT